ncbi:MAG TPA: myo-inosose-2 dehydratase [Chthoniobacterales bacterium]|nr:myo-inosose-2 dehydratase [Chthoniobacterales bacterium]
MAKEILLPGVRLGVSPLSWTNDVLAELGGDIPLETCLQDAAEIGYEGVELGRKFPRDGQKLSSILSSYGLRLAGGWYSGFLTERSVEEEWKAAAEHVRLLKDCGSQVLVYGECGLMTGTSPWDEPLSQRPNLKTNEFSAYAGRLGEFAIRLKETGITLAYHYHLKMLVETAEEIDALCESTREEVGLLLDTGHAYAAGADYTEIVRKFGSRIVHIHLKDVRRDTLERARKNDWSFNSAVREGMFTVPEDGDIDFSAIGGFLRTSGYGGWVVVEAEQDPAKAPPRLFAGKAYHYLRELLS